MLQTFIQNMLPKDAEAVYGKGMAGDMWKSLMAEQARRRRWPSAAASASPTACSADHYVDGDKTSPDRRRLARPASAAETDRQAHAVDRRSSQEMQRTLTDAA